MKFETIKQMRKPRKHDLRLEVNRKHEARSKCRMINELFKDKRIHWAIDYRFKNYRKQVIKQDFNDQN